jgi:hypothetical protein
VVWLAVVLAWVAVVWSTGFDDREGAIGFSIPLYPAPLIAFAAAIAGPAQGPRLRYKKE